MNEKNRVYSILIAAALALSAAVGILPTGKVQAEAEDNAGDAMWSENIEGVITQNLTTDRYYKPVYFTEGKTPDVFNTCNVPAKAVGEGISFDPATQTLKLDNYNEPDEELCVSCFPGKFTVEVTGECTINRMSFLYDENKMDVVLAGDGKLTVSSSSYAKPLSLGPSAVNLTKTDASLTIEDSLSLDLESNAAGSVIEMHWIKHPETALAIKGQSNYDPANKEVVTASENHPDIYRLFVNQPSLKTGKFFTEEQNASLKMQRLYNPNSGEHFYTSDQKEINHLTSIGWKAEGDAWTAPEKSDTPVYRLYNPNTGDHHYTTGLDEKNALVSKGWKYESIGWYSDGSVPVYRAYNPNAKGAGSHHYTTDITEIKNLTSKGWKDEGIAWYGL